MWLMNRMTEGSTWRGLVMLLTALGISLSPEQAAAIIACGMSVSGLLGVFWGEKKTF